MNTELFDIKIRAVEGGVTAAAGFKAAGIHAGFRKNPERLDYALVVPDKPCPGAGVFTTNRFCAAPVQVRLALHARARRAALHRRSSAANPSRFWLPPRV